MYTKTLYIGLLLLILISDSCTEKNEIPNNKQITEIILETIKQDSLDINIPINETLVNRYIYVQQYDNELGYLPPPPRNAKGDPFVFRFYKKSKVNSLGFNQIDSIFVAKQVTNNKDITLNLSIIPKDIIIKNVPVFLNNELRLYQFLIPLFNINEDYAIVEYEYQCPSCGYGRIVILQKHGDKWIKKEAFTSWRS